LAGKLRIGLKPAKIFSCRVKFTSSSAADITAQASKIIEILTRSPWVLPNGTY
jgi:hypothetical protein